LGRARYVIIASRDLETLIGLICSELTVPMFVLFHCKGWHLVLDVPKESSSTLLPRAELPPLVQKNLSELHSAPGRQAASLIRTTHLRSLAAPLSAVATATSLAETNPSVAVSSDGTLPYKSFNLFACLRKRRNLC
jgi:hypothetical protein